MDGILLVDKPMEWTSMDVCAHLRGVLHERHVGHTGTLDPNATGLLVVLTGKGTKLARYLENDTKEYVARIRLGIKTNTQDIWGEVISRHDVVIARNEIESSLEQFIGNQLQIPPMYSAVKVGGMKLVDAARAGKEIERKKRTVTVYEYSDITWIPEELQIGFTVKCSKGTYVRTICEDIGAFAGIPACMAQLERISAAGLTKDSAITLSEAAEYAADGTLADHIIPVDSFLKEYKPLIVTCEAVKRLIYGNYLYEEDIADLPEGKENPVSEEGYQIFRVYDAEGKFRALYRYDPKDRCYKCGKMFS